MITNKLFYTANFNKRKIETMYTNNDRAGYYTITRKLFKVKIPCIKIYSPND